jgi:3-mercaptopyruvate sulfurtransferase SseA
MQSSFHTSKFITAAQLAARMASEHVCVLDCSTEAPASHAHLKAKEYFDNFHIPSAQFLDIANLKDTTSPYPNTIPSLA